MERLITTLGDASVRRMRERFGYATINQAIQDLGLATKRRHYTDALKNRAKELMRTRYNEIVNEINSVAMAERNRTRQATRTFLRSFNVDVPVVVARNLTQPRMTIRRLTGFVSNWNRHNNANNSAFEVRIRSGVANIAHTFRFSNTYHFHNWYAKVITDGTIMSIDSGNERLADNFKDIFNGLMTIQNIRLVAGGCNCHESGIKKMVSSFYKFNLFNPASGKKNNCFFASLRHITKNENHTGFELRKAFGLKGGTEVSVGDAYRIIHELKLAIEIRDYETNEELVDDVKYIIYKDNHYYVLESWEEITKKDKKTKRGLMTFDFETRATEEFNTIKATGQKMYLLQDSLCKVYYRCYKQTECKSNGFVTTKEKSSARQFIDFLNSESKQGRTYNVLAHNGGRFDFYFLISQMTPKELRDSEPHFRGTTIISLNYRGNLFKDSCCFLTETLEKLSAQFKINDGKIVTMNLHGKDITSGQLCFYKPELTFQQFLDLQQTDTEFWKLYDKYCLYDCISLFQIWEKFTVCINGLIAKINPFLLRLCPLMASMTIGSHSKKILVEMNKVKGKINYYKQHLEAFIDVRTVDDKYRICDYEKYNFLCKFKRGGISHCHQAGKHLTGITGVDIASQYPAALVYAKIPTGKSDWITEYDASKHGFYWINKVVFNSYTFKPVARSEKGLSLDWATNNMEELYVDSYMLKYLIENYGLVSFNVVKGLVSKSEVDGLKIFGNLVNPFYDEKKLQDDYKESGDELYNEALRQTIKLYLNSLTGKLVEEPSSHFSLTFNAPIKEGDTDTGNHLRLNGEAVTQKFDAAKFNDWIVAGIMVYSYSKRLLFEYIKCLPNNSDDVIHVETDGIYFSTALLPTFEKKLEDYKGEYPCKLGKDLGNLKIEKTTQKGQVAYFLGKKFYNITFNNDYLTEPRDDKDKSIYRIKGIPQKTIETDGTPKFLVNTQLYEDVYAGKAVLKSFQTLKKNLFVTNSSIATLTMTRTIKPSGNYKLYN